MTPTARIRAQLTVEGLVSWELVEQPEPDDFRLGFTEPTRAGLYTPAAVCGPRVPETSMRNYDGTLTNVADGELVDRLVISGAFRPESTGWTLRDSMVLGGTPDGDIYPLLDVRDGAIETGLIEFTEVAPTYRGYEVYGYKGGNVTLSRSIIAGVVDGVQPHGSGSYPDTRNKSVRLRGCLVDELATFSDPGQSDGITHNDAVQAAGALELLEIHGCALRGGRTSAILLQQNQGLFGHVLVVRNWLYGAADQGSTFNTSQNGRGVICADGLLAVIGNRFDRAGNAPVALVSRSTLEAPTTLWAGNVWMDDGTPVEPASGADR